MPFTEAEREFLTSVDAIVEGPPGCRTMRGLTREETREYLDYVRSEGARRRELLPRYLLLSERHHAMMRVWLRRHLRS